MLLVIGITSYWVIDTLLVTGDRHYGELRILFLLVADILTCYSLSTR